MAAQWSPPSDYRARPVTVLGGGVLGRRIAACFVSAGYHVIVRDPSEKSRTDALSYIKENITAFLVNSRGHEGTYEAIEDLPTAVKDSWLVFEAVPELLALKETTFADLEKYAPKDCILATNSSSFKSGELLGKVRDGTKARVLNTHYMMPPQAVIVELMTSGHTPESLTLWVAERHKEAGLHPVIALKESTGFIFNRIWAAIKREVMNVLAEGVATPATIDSIWVEMYGSKVGLDTVEHIEQHYVLERKGLPTNALDWLRENYIEKGKLGLKSGNGGLYPPPLHGSKTKLLLLNNGLGEQPGGGINVPKMLSSGEILEFIAENPAGKPLVLVNGQQIPDGIDICDGRMYWTSMGNPAANDGTVQSAKLDGSDIKVVVPAGKVHTPKQLHIDQLAKKIYFSDREGLRVHRCNLDGSQHEILIETGNWETEPEKAQDAHYWPVGVCVSTKLNKFFWTQKGPAKAGAGKILSASLEMPPGSSAANRKDIEVVAQNLPECIDLEFDDDAGALYWTDRGELPLGNSLNKKQLVGFPPAAEKPLGHQIIARGFGEAIGLRSDKANNHIYVSDLCGRVWKCSPDGGEKVKIYESPSHSYTGLAFVKV